MRIKKKVVKYISMILVILLTSILYFEFIFNNDSTHINFIVNTLISLFSSALLIFIVYLIEYFIERRYALEKIYIEGYKIVNIISKIKYFKEFDRLDDERYYNKLLEIIKTYCEIDKNNFNGFEEAYSNLDFIYANRTKRKEIYENTYLEFKEFQKLILENAFHFKLFLNDDDVDNIDIVCIKLSNIQKKIFRSEIYCGSSGYTQSIYFTYKDELIENLEKIRDMNYKIKNSSDSKKNKPIRIIGNKR